MSLGAPREQYQQHSLYKTELCRSWEETGSCRYGVKCQFAHGRDELRPVMRHPKYKTEVCRTFAQSGTCPYGTRCRFIHYRVPKKSVLGVLVAGAHNVIPADWCPDGSGESGSRGSGSPGSTKRLPIFREIASEAARGDDAESGENDASSGNAGSTRRVSGDSDARRIPKPHDVCGSVLFGNA